MNNRKKIRAVLIITAGLAFLSAWDFAAAVPQDHPHSTLEGDQITPALAYDRQGRFITAWVSIPQDDGLPGVYARLFHQNGHPFSPEFKVNTYWNPVEHPAVAACPSGFVVVWTSFWTESSTSGAVAARKYDPWGNPAGDEFQVNEYPWGFQGNPAADMDTQGRFIIAWQSWEQDGDGYGVYAKIFNSKGEPESLEFQVNTTTLGNQDQPAVAAAGDGSFIITWRSSLGETGHGIFAQRFDRRGNRLGPEFQVNFTSLGTAENPDIDIDSYGNFYITWHHNRLDENGYDVYVRIFDPTGTLKSQEIRVNTSAAGMQAFPSLACTSEGHFLVSWLNRPGQELSRIMGRTFDRYGQPLSDEYIISGSRNRIRENPAAAVISFNDMIFIWQEYEPLDTGWDLFQKIMSPPSLTFQKNGGTRREKTNATKNPLRDMADRFFIFPGR